MFFIVRFWIFTDFGNIVNQKREMIDKPNLLEMGRRIRTLRGKASRREFAEGFLVAQSSLARWESGESPPDLGFVIRLLSAYNVSLEWLIFGKEYSKNEKLTADKQFALLDDLKWVNGIRSDAETKFPDNATDTSVILEKQSLQQTDFISGGKPGEADASPFLRLTEQNVALQRDLLESVRQNGDLRVEAERLRMDIERRDARIAELERQLAEALKPHGGQILLDQGRAAAG